VPHYPILCEKEDLVKYRAGINPKDSELGKTVFDSGS
jgi:hypothetical protein